MANLTNRKPILNRIPITPQRIAMIRVWNDLLILIVSFIFLSQIMESNSARIVLGCAIGMFFASLFGYFLIQRDQTIVGMGFVIYGLLVGLTTISVFVEKLGPFAIVTMVLVTSISVSYAIPFRRVLEAVSTSLVLGIFSLVYDLNTRGADFRLTAPEQLILLLWLVTFILIGIISYLIIRQFRFFSLRAKMITSFTAITILALSLLGFLNSRSVRNVLTEQANISLYNAASQTEESLRQFITSNSQSIETEAHLPTLIEYFSQPGNQGQNLEELAQNTLIALAGKNPDYIASYALLDLNGKVLLDTQINHVGDSEADFSYFTEILGQTNSIMSPVEIDPFTFEPSIYFGSPVMDQGDNLIGILRARYHADILQNIIEKSNHRGGENSFAVLFDEHLIHLGHGIKPDTLFTSVVPLDDALFERLINERRLPNQTKDATFLDLYDLEKNLKTAQNSDKGFVYFEATDIATGDLINQVVVLDMKEPAWLLAFFQPQEIYLSPIETLANNTILLGLLSGFGAVILGIVLTQILTRPILNLTETAEQISKGDFEAQVEISTEDEVGNLGKTFNKMSIQLQNLISNLENQVNLRTKSLQNQTAQLRASAEVARDAISEQNLQDLLNRTANLIYDRFGYYHVGIYLNDRKNENTNLAASTDQPGIKLLMAEQSYRINTESNVGYACVLGEAIVASGSENTAQIAFHPLLPNSQAQLVLPLNIGNQTIGAIDIHSTNPASFSKEEVQIYQTLSDQIAIAIQKAKYQEEIKGTLSELEAAYGIFTKESWQRFVHQNEKISGYRYNHRKVEPVKFPSQEVVKAWKDGNKVTSQYRSSIDPELETSTLAIPLKVRGEVIGVLNIEFETSNIPTDTTDLIHEIADRLGLILENARLVETAQRRFEREQLTSQITNTIRQSLDMDMVIRTAVQQIGESLGLAEVELRLGSPDQIITSTKDESNGNQDLDSMRK